MIDPTKEADLKKFHRIRQRDFKAMKDYREHVRDRWVQYTGGRYSTSRIKYQVPVNLMAMVVDIWLDHFAARSPAVMVEAETDELERTAFRLETAATKLVSRKIPFTAEARRWVKNALFGWGMMKVGLNRSQSVEYLGEPFDPGQPFAKSVSLDNFVVDMLADTWEERAYAADKYRVTLDEAEQMAEEDIWDGDAVRKLKATHREQINEDGSRKLRELGADVAEPNERLEPTLWVWEPHFPRYQMLLTIPENQPDIQLRKKDMVEWEGPEHGPYHPLGFRTVADCLLPLAPTAHLQDMSLLANNLWRKLGRQARRQKTNSLVQTGNEKDAKSVRDAHDGDVLGVDDPNSGRELRSGGPDNVVLAMYLQTQDQFNWFAGNPESLGGLSAQSRTLGQDRMLSEAASARVNAMQQDVLEATAEVIRDICWYLFTDPFIDMPLTKRMPSGRKMRMRLRPEDMEGDFDYNFEIAPFSMQIRSPQMVMAAYRQVLNDIAPFLPMMAAQGVQIDFQKLMRKWERLTNLDLDDILTLAPPQVQESLVGQPPMKAPTSERRYVRENVPGSSRSGRAQVMANLLSGGNVQPAEARSMFQR